MEIGRTRVVVARPSSEHRFEVFNAPQRLKSANSPPLKNVGLRTSTFIDGGGAFGKSADEVAQMVAALQNSFPPEYWAKAPPRSTYFIHEHHFPITQSAYPIYCFENVYASGGPQGLATLRSAMGLELHFHQGNPLPQLAAIDFDNATGGRSWLNFQDAPWRYRREALEMIEKVQAGAANRPAPLGVLNSYL
jgi:hypothetical protein